MVISSENSEVSVLELAGVETPVRLPTTVADPSAYAGVMKTLPGPTTRPHPAAPTEPIVVLPPD